MKFLLKCFCFAIALVIFSISDKCTRSDLQTNHHSPIHGFGNLFNPMTLVDQSHLSDFFTMFLEPSCDVSRRQPGSANQCVTWDFVSI